jgi:hypothetical protein
MEAFRMSRSFVAVLILMIGMFRRSCIRAGGSRSWHEGKPHATSRILARAAIPRVRTAGRAG